MKRAILISFLLTLGLAVPLAGCGLVHAAGGILLGGGGLSMALLMTLALIGGRAMALAPRAAAAATAPTVATAPKGTTEAVAQKPQAIVVEVAAPDARPPEIEEVAESFVKAAVKHAAPPVDDFAADELAFFAEGENQAMRASDSSPHWHLG